MKNEMTLDQKELVKLARKGDAHAFSLLYGQIYEDLYRFALYTLRHREDAEDAVSEACLKAYQSMYTLRKAEKFRSWMFQITANECRMILRSKARHPEAELKEEISADGEALSGGSGDVSDAEQTELRLDVQDALSKLEEDERMVILLSVFGGYSSREIGEVLGMASGTVRSKRSRGYEKMRPYFSEQAGAFA